MGKTLTFQEIDSLSRDFAAYLQSIPGLKPGDRIAIQLPNLLQFPIALYGALRAGLTVVNTNPLYTEREMEFQFRDSGAKAIVICANFAAQLQRILSKTSLETVIVTEIGDALPIPKRWIVNRVIRHVKKMVPKYHLPKALGWNEVLRKGASLPFQKPTIRGTDLAFIQYTGGTTGVAKGAMLEHRNMVANMEQIAAWVGLTLNAGNSESQVAVSPLPLYHIFSLTVTFFIFKTGIQNIFITNPRDIPGFINELKKWRVSLLTGVNTLYNALLNHPDFATVDFSSLRVCIAGAMALQRPVLEKWKSVTGTTILEGYGLTETSPVVCCNPTNGEDRPGTIGLPLPSTEVKLVDESGNAVAPGQAGEIAVRGPQVMRGYWQRPEESKIVFLQDGWMRTGDVAEFTEDGYVRIVDRKKDMITVSGFKVYPNEVEEVLAGHPKVLEAGVIGVPDPHSGEVVKAFVVRKDNSLTEEEVMTYAKKHLTNYKVPRKIEFITTLPKTNVGKVLRRELKSA
jgi:long-chain acyl-CoA synthetase